jgi:hypothetical protein
MLDVHVKPTLVCFVGCKTAEASVAKHEGARKRLMRWPPVDGQPAFALARAACTSQAVRWLP